MTHEPLNRDELETLVIAIFLAILLIAAIVSWNWAAIVLCLGVFIALAYSMEVPRG